ncbi:hypothetical protein Tco_1284482 [Tanacetum coccineum]
MMEQAGKQQETKYTITSSDTNKLQEFDQKIILFETMTKTKSFNKNTKHKDLYHALMKSIHEDEDAMDKGVANNQNLLVEDMGNTDEPPIVNADPKDWFKKPERTPTPDPEWNNCKTVHNKPTQKWLSNLSKVEKSSKTFDDLLSTPIDFSAFAMNRLQIKQTLQLKGEDIVHLAAALHITDLEPYTTYSNPKCVIYLHKLERNRLMYSHGLYKFSDGTRISVRDKLKYMLNNLQIGYTSVIPRRRWSNLDKKRSRIMVNDIDHQLLERRLMRSLEKFVGRREYEEDLRLLQRTI